MVNDSPCNIHLKLYFFKRPDSVKIQKRVKRDGKVCFRRHLFLQMHYLLAVLSRSHAGILAEDPYQVARIIKAGCGGDFGDGFHGIFQIAANFFDPVPEQIFDGTLTDSAVQEFVEVVGRNFGGGGEFAESEFFGIVVGYEVKKAAELQCFGRFDTLPGDAAFAEYGIEQADQ